MSWNLLLCLETQELAAPEDSAAYQACPVLPVKKDLKATLDCLDLPVVKVTEERPEDLETRAPLDLTGQEEHLDP